MPKHFEIVIFDKQKYLQNANIIQIYFTNKNISLTHETK